MASFYRDLFLDRMQGKAFSSAIRGDIFSSSAARGGAGSFKKVMYI